MHTRVKPAYDACVCMSAPFHLRPYAAADEDAAIALWRDTWQQAYPSIDFAARVNWWRERWRKELVPNANIVVAEQAGALTELDKQIPPEIAWVLRVDGHTDVRPILNSPVFKSNWELSSARAISVVQYLVSLGVPAQRLVAAGFAEFQPLDTAQTEDAYKRNRRIELKLTER